MKKTILYMVLAMLCLFFKTTAQDAKIRGRVVTRSDNKPLPGASVKIKGTMSETQTDTDGKFSIAPVDDQTTLIISYTGFKTIEVSASLSQKDLQIALEEENEDLNEVVVIGYGQTTRKLNTGSVSSISAKQIEQQPVTNVLSALSGRMPGVFVQTTNGLPGGNINIQIRGKGSLLAGNNPLYIIDGVPYDGNSPNTVTSTQSTNSIAGNISPLNNLNPADIESITVLKDADATSIYGSRGTNGVILISTKRSKTGRLSLDVDLQSSISSVSQKPDLLSLPDYLTMRREAFANDNLVPSSIPTSANYAPDLTVWSQENGVDWADYIYGKTARSDDFKSKISGGSDKTTFSIGTNYRHESTILPGKNDYARYGLSSQIQHTTTDGKLRIALSNQYSRQSTNFVNPVLNMARIFLLAPNYPIYLPDGSYNWYSPNNIDAELNNRSKNTTEYTLTNINLGYQILTGLGLKLNAGYTKTTYDQTLIFPSKGLYPGTANYSMFSDNALQSIILEPQLEYQIKSKSSTFSFLIGGTYQNRNSKSQFIQVSNFRLESLMENISSASTLDSRSNSIFEYKYASVFGRVTYNLSNSYLLNATLRRDGSSRFGPGNRFGNFGSIGGAWIFSNLDFLKQNATFLSYGKLRGSYGTTGNDQIPDYQYLSTYNSPGTNYQDIGIVKPNRISNDDFHWETTRKTDIAIELGLFQNKINITADYYINRSKDQLVNYTLPQITGFPNYQANLPAVVENKGWEFSLNAHLIQKTNFSWQASFNLTAPKNKLVSFENFDSSTYANLYEIGYDITRIWGYKFMGVDDLTGRAQYAGRDGEISGTPYNNFTLGKLTPDFFGGFGNVFTCKNLELNIFAQFVKQVANGGLQYSPGVSIYNNFGYLKDRWTPSNPESEIPRSGRSSDNNYTASSFNIFNTSYLRLKNLSIGYEVNSSHLKKVGVNRLKIQLDAQNILTIWDKNAAIFDPESGAVAPTAGSKNVPPLKTFALGLKFTL